MIRASYKAPAAGGLLLPTLLCLSLAAGPVAAQNEMDDVQIETVRVTDGIYMLTGQGGNIGLCVGEDGVFMIDDQYAPLSAKITAAVGAISDQPVGFILNTHWHGDHTGGNENFGETGTMIFSHANVRRRLSTEQFTAIFDRTTPAAPDGALPVVTFTDSLSFFLNGEEINVFHAPRAHTDGDGVIHFTAANVIHSGDLVFFGLYPYIDTSAGGSIDGLIAGVQTILALCDDQTKIIPGHGPLLGKSQVEEYLALLTGARAAVLAEKSAGKDLAAVQAARPLAAWDEAWGHVWLTSDQFAQMIFESLP